MVVRRDAKQWMRWVFLRNSTEQIVKVLISIDCILKKSRNNDWFSRLVKRNSFLFFSEVQITIKQVLQQFDERYGVLIFLCHASVCRIVDIYTKR